MSSCIVWFRHDLRLADNPALAAAVQTGLPIVPVFILDDATPGVRGPGAASRWWLHHSLAALDADLRKRGSRLVLRRGPAETVLADLVAASGATAVHWNRLYEIAARERDARIKQALAERGIVATSHKANLLFEPWEVKTGAGDPFKVFTPFWRACRQLPPPERPLPAPDRLAAPAAWPASDALEAWRLLPRTPDWAGGLRDSWNPGEASAHRRLEDFVDDTLARYRDERDLPARAGTSRLSPHLAFGELSPRQVWHAATAREPSAATEKFLAEVGWREFCNNLIFHFGNLAENNFRADFDAFPWAAEDAKVEAWRRGRTGYPIVDAGMRELWTTGWMHNRVRMIVASFLAKDLMVDWRVGERWFWDTLVDADPANNPAGWQWVAGSGADAQPYFRIFNPVLQGEKFDPDGAYVRHWVPEVARLPAQAVHKPWTARSQVDPAYPLPIVDHAQARDRALAAFRSLKQEP
ncbi:MAG: DNA photolyase family protein [Proteobacteria bacterium]|nr:DNA photolyase family protein [Pseudomonadota bacterium]